MGTFPKANSSGDIIVQGSILAINDHCPPDRVVLRIPLQRIAGDVAMGITAKKIASYVTLLVSSNGALRSASWCRRPCQRDYTNEHRVMVMPLWTLIGIGHWSWNIYFLQNRLQVLYSALR